MSTPLARSRLAAPATEAGPALLFAQGVVQLSGPSAARSHGRQQYGEASRSSRNTTFARAATTKRSTRSFVLKWTDLDGWSKKYDVEQIAREVKPDDWALFVRVLDETKAVAEAVNVARE